MTLLAFALAHAEDPSFGADASPSPRWGEGEEAPVYRPQSTEEYRGRRGPPPRHHRRADVAPAPPERNVTLTVDLVDLPMPLLSAGVELGVGRRVGLGVNGGVGFYPQGALYDVGAEVRGYFLGDFDVGLYVGAGGGTTNLTPLTLGDQAVTAEATLGAKYTFPVGFSADMSVGVAYYGMPELGLVSPTGRIGVGWSF
jgi:hypothetical protein